ncbi:MAG: RNA polymerase sigma factor [Slackia sp.]|nr:RNA polymerase sigma factor [Slackia sp.]
MNDWADTVYRIALSHTRSISDAEDITQDVFVRLLKSTTSFENDEHLKAWLISVTLNRCREIHRMSERRRATPTATVPDMNTSPPADEYFIAKASAVWSALSDLPPTMRSAMHLRYVEGYSAEEIAGMARCRPSTVRSWLFRARKKMKASLEGKGAL